MWHEARRQEKKVREVMVNLQRRAERRKEHYEKLMGDPMQLLRITGRKAKIHLDPAVAAAGDSKTTMMPWSGNPEILISQYDVRVHLETIPDYSKLPKPQLSAVEYAEEMKCNYERYRNLVINLFQEVSEEDYLKRLNIEEMYPKHSAVGVDKDKVSGKAAIGYSYGDSVTEDYNMSDNDSDVESIHEEEVAQLNVDDLSATDVDKLNLCALEFKISAGYFGRMLHDEKSYQSQQQYARQMAAETKHLHGKHAKRERRLFRESKRFSHVQTTPPSYAQRDSPTYEPYESNDRNQSRSRSSTPEAVQSKVEYITEFGTVSDNEEGSSNKNAYSQGRHKSSATSPRSSTHRRRSPPTHSSSRRRSRSSSRRRSRSRSRSRERHRRHHRSRSRDSDRRRYRSRSSSKERYSHKSYSRSRASYYRSRYSNSRSRTRSRSPPHHSRSRYHRSRSSSSDNSSSNSSRTPSPVKKRPAKPPTSERKDSSSKKPAGTKSKLTPQERLQKKLQLQLNKQLKQDKKTQKIKANMKAAEQMEREDDLREQARKWKSRDTEGYYRD